MKWWDEGNQLLHRTSQLDQERLSAGPVKCSSPQEQLNEDGGGWGGGYIQTKKQLSTEEGKERIQSNILHTYIGREGEEVHTVKHLTSHSVLPPKALTRYCSVEMQGTYIAQ